MNDVKKMIISPVPDTGPVLINREGFKGNFEDCCIMQHGNGFRLHGPNFSFTLEPIDALWIIEELKLRANPSEIMRRVVIWMDN